jgi:hypothetical protein
MAGVELVLEVPGYHQGAATPGFLLIHSQVQNGPLPFAMKFILRKVSDTIFAFLVGLLTRCP